MHYSSTGNRPLDKIRDLKVIDLGGANSFAHGFLDAIGEIREPQADAKYKFIGDMNMPEFWEPILKHVEEHGKWDYAISTHTMEDIANPLFACRMMEKIAKAGIVVVPSKFRELARFSGEQRGFMHHRWIFDVVDGVFTGFPKINYIEKARFDDVHHDLPGREELVHEWEGEINLHLVNEDMPYNGDEHMKECYDLLLRNDDKMMVLHEA